MSARSAAPALLASLALAACSYPQLSVPPPPSQAFDRPLETELGRLVEQQAAVRPGETGLYVLSSGLDAFAARIALADRARAAIDLQVYIFRDDLTGRWLLSRLLAAADRGVRVRLLLDDMGSAGIDHLIAAADVHEHLEVRLFNPAARGPLPGLARKLDVIWRPKRLNHRMHNKLMAADGIAGIVGGRNVGDEYFDAAEAVNFGDLDLLALGPVAVELGESFDLYWNSPFAIPLDAWSRLSREPEELEALRAELREHERANADSRYGRRLKESGFVREAVSGELPLTWAVVHAASDLPEKVVARGEQLQGTLLVERGAERWARAERELIVVSAYFVPGDGGVEQLAAAVARGARVRVLTNSLAATDVPAVHAGYEGYREPLLRAGVELHELRPSGGAVIEAHRQGLLGSSSASLHAKTFVADRELVFVGSFNLDPRSINLNTELGLVVESPEIAARLVERFEEAVRPGVSWRLALDERGLAWEGEQDGETVVLRDEPDASWRARLAVRILGWLPIEGQL